jgi:RecA-family ATPase
VPAEQLERLAAEGTARVKPAAEPATGEAWPAPLDLAALAEREPEAPRFIVPDWLPCGYATLLAGHGGVGKSAIALHLAVAIALGARWAGLDCAPRKALYLSGEDRTGVLHWRLSRIARHMGIALVELVGRLEIVELVGHDAIVWERDPRTGYCFTPAFGQLSECVRSLAPEVLVVDGVTDTFGGNENSRGEVKRYVNALLSLVPAETGALLLLAHVDKAVARGTGATSDGYSGSTAWHNSARARWYLRPETQQAEDEDRPERTGTLLLELQKSNLGPVDHSISWRWDDEMHMFLPGPPTTAFDRQHEAREARRGVLKALAASPATPAATTGRRTAYHVLSARPEFPKSLRGGKPEIKRFWAHIEALRAIGYIREGSIRRSDRHYVTTLELTPEGLRACGQ